jgi:hypothetical protein
MITLIPAAFRNAASHYCQLCWSPFSVLSVQLLLQADCNSLTLLCAVMPCIHSVP